MHLVFPRSGKEYFKMATSNDWQHSVNSCISFFFFLLHTSFFQPIHTYAPYFSYSNFISFSYAPNLFLFKNEIFPACVML